MYNQKKKVKLVQSGFVEVEIFLPSYMDALVDEKWIRWTGGRIEAPLLKQRAVEYAIKLVENPDQEYGMQTRETVMWMASLLDCYKLNLMVWSSNEVAQLGSGYKYVTIAALSEKILVGMIVRKGKHCQ